MDHDARPDERGISLQPHAGIGLQDGRDGDDGAGIRWRDEVGVAALNIGTYLNAFTNAPQDAPCRSTGVLEAEIMDAIRAGPPDEPVALSLGQLALVLEGGPLAIDGCALLLEGEKLWAASGGRRPWS